MTTFKRLTFLLAIVSVFALPAVAQAKRRDRDHDRLPDRWERKFHLSTHRNSARGNPDHDGLSNRGEFLSRTNPRRRDTDRDGIRDGNEDRDRDRVDNHNEMRERTSPRRRDTDRDGIRDGREDRDRDGLNNRGEDRTGNDPIDRDTDDDGVEDGDENAGQVVSFENGILTIDPFNGPPISARVVTGVTEIECEGENEAEHENEVEERATASHDGSDGGDNSGPSDNSGPGNAEDREAGDRDDDEAEDACPASALTPGTPVEEAELSSDGTTWREIELIR